MSGNAIANVDDFGITIPAPNEPFTATVIHPRNLAIQERQSGARKLTKREYGDALKEVKALRKSLQDVGYYDLLGEYKALKQRYKVYQRELELATTEEDRAEQTRLLQVVTVKGGAIHQSLTRFKPLAVKYETLMIELRTHDQEVEREQAHAKLNKLMREEAGRWKEIIIRHWTRLGMAYEHYDNKGRRIVDQVQFEQIVVTPDVVWFKVAISVKTMFGHRSVLPHRVPVRDLIEEKTLLELSYACQRQVTAEASYASGVWILLHRLGTTDGLIEYVTLEQVLQYYPYESRHLMPVPLGVGERREIKWLMLAEHPHFLVGGSTGNGKSNFTHAIICSLIRFQSPDDLRLVFIDLKEGVEFNVYQGIPHQQGEVIRRVEDAVNMLSTMEAFRGERMEIISKAGCTDILEYNEKYPDKKMPRIVIFVDEYARLKARGKEFAAIADTAVGEITALGRAAGIHLFAATQTPYASIMPGEAKNNMTVRVAFAMRTLAASQSILDSGEARRLPMEIKGRGLGAVGSVAFEFQTAHAPHEYRTDSAKLAMGTGDKEDVEVLKLPETIKIDVFDENELLDIAINELGGNLGSQPIFDFVKQSGQTPLSQVREMVKRVKDRGEVEFEGKCYRVRPWGKGWRLELKTDEHTDGKEKRRARRNERLSIVTPVDPSFHESEGGYRIDVVSELEAETTDEAPEEITAVALEQVELES